jgi:hypothetical protein
MVEQIEAAHVADRQDGGDLAAARHVGQRRPRHEQGPWR